MILAAVLDIPKQKRRNMAGPVHARPGPYLAFDKIFVDTLGPEWRQDLENCPDYDTWKRGCKAFVLQCCISLGLPVPYPGNQHIHMKGDSESVHYLELPRQLQRDTLWLVDGTPQLEFVVDNESLASLANIEISVVNPLYLTDVHRIRQGLLNIFETVFWPKGSYMNPVDWRPREFNGPPDTIYNWVLDQETDLNHLCHTSAINAIQNGRSIQIHSDGGFKSGRGAASFVVHACDPSTGMMSRLGYSGHYMHAARSAFHAEILALLLAVDWMHSLKTYLCT